jgi:hypothetical protein
MTNQTVKNSFDTSVIFKPTSLANGLAAFHTDPVNTDLDRKRLTMTSRKVGKGPLARSRIKLLVEVPQVSTASVADGSGFVPNPKVAFINRVTIEFEIHPNSNSTQRDELQWLATGLATGNADVTNLVQVGQAIF